MKTLTDNEAFSAMITADKSKINNKKIFSSLEILKRIKEEIISTDAIITEQKFYSSKNGQSFTAIISSDYLKNEDYELCVCFSNSQHRSKSFKICVGIRLKKSLTFISIENLSQDNSFHEEVSKLGDYLVYNANTIEAKFLKIKNNTESMLTGLFRDQIIGTVLFDTNVINDKSIINIIKKLKSNQNEITCFDLITNIIKEVEDNSDYDNILENNMNLFDIISKESVNYNKKIVDNIHSEFSKTYNYVLDPIINTNTSVITETSTALPF